MTITPTRLTFAAGALVAAGILLSGCSAINSVLPDVIEAIEDETTDAAWLAVGDCFNDSGDEVVTDVPTVPCTEAHDNEIYAEFDIDLATFPGDDELFRLADEGCLAPFDVFVGIPFDDSALDYTYYVPTKDGWNDYDDRAVSCLIFDPAGQSTGSLAGVAR